MRHHILLLLFSFLLFAAPTTKAQDSLNSTSITYDLTMNAAIGSGDFTATPLTDNQYHTLSTRPNTAYIRGAVNLSHKFNKDWTLSGAIDGMASIHGDHKTYLQQCYANLSYDIFFVEAGSRELTPALRDKQLSLGNFVNGTNAKPIPQVHFGTNGFWTVPFTKEWLLVNFDFGYGKFMDSKYREDSYMNSPDVNLGYTTDAYFHQKHLYFRSNPQKRIFVTVGIEHAVQFGGTSYSRESGTLVAKKKPANLRAFWEVILPIGDSQYFENEAMEDWVYGNHIGMMTAQIGWNINDQHQLQAYLDNIFEDGSGIRKSNGLDGLWGLQYNNKTKERQLVRGAVIEYFQSTNQSGPLHWDGGDYPEPIRSQITDKVTGNDDYYNHLFYDGYSHYGMTPGNPLITSPIYNKDGYTSYRDNRIEAWHLGINGELTNSLSYVLKGSYHEGWGTYNYPLATRHHSFDTLVEGRYTTGPWLFSAAYALNHGNIYGNNSTFNVKIVYHGKIL